MQLWFARGSEVTIREQLVTQIVLGILSDDLRPGQRLPSTRELARRFRLHPNTVSAGYRQLERERWVEFRHGSGVYVQENKPEVPPSLELVLDQLVANLFRSARRIGVPLSTVRCAPSSMARHAASRSLPVDRTRRSPQTNPDRRDRARRNVPRSELRSAGLPEDGRRRHSSRSSESRRGCAPNSGTFR